MSNLKEELSSHPADRQQHCKHNPLQQLID